MREARSERGYTLVEILVVIAILAMIATMVTGYLPARRDAHALRLQVYRLETDLRAARNEALASGTTVLFTIDVASGSWSYARQPARSLPHDIGVKLYTGRSLMTGNADGAIAFFPSGQSSGGHVILRMAASEGRIDIDWLTGRIHEHSDE